MGINDGTDRRQHIVAPHADEAFGKFTPQVFRTTDGTVFADIDTKRGRETVPITGKRFRQYLTLKLNEGNGKMPSQAALTSFIDQLAAHAWQAGAVEDIHTRVAWLDGRAYLDLADDRGRVVEIGPEGWEVIDTAPVHFVRTPNMLPLPVPERGGSIDDLRSLINVDDDDFVLVVACILDGLREGRSHPVLVLTGAEGTAKSTQLAILNCLIDPQPISGLPATELQLGRISDRYLFPFDNVSAMSRQVADALCRLSTTHPIIINCVGDVVAWPDLVDRCVFATCAYIQDEQRRTEKDIWTEFERNRGQILGVLLDAVAHGLCSLPTTRPHELPRMADFANWTISCEGAFWPPRTFVVAYSKNRAEAAERLIENDVVTTAVQRLMARREEWIGTAKGLLSVLGLSEQPQAPRTPRGLGGYLRRVGPLLSKIGITIEFGRAGHHHDRVITVSRKRPDAPIRPQETSSEPSAPSAEPGEEDAGAVATPAQEANVEVSGTTDEVKANTAARENDYQPFRPRTMRTVQTRKIPKLGSLPGKMTRQRHFKPRLGSRRDLQNGDVDCRAPSALSDEAQDDDGESGDKVSSPAASARTRPVDAPAQGTIAPRRADDADGKIIDKSTMLVRSVLKGERAIPVYQRRNRSCKKRNRAKENRCDQVEAIDTFETNCLYHGDTGTICEAAITMG